MPTLSRPQPSRAVFLCSSLSKFSRTVGFLSMASQGHLDPTETQFTNDAKTLSNYPVPLSPPLPSLSKDIELSRAMSASSRSALFSLSRSDVLFEDEWLLAVNKPQGVYCETVLSSVSSLLKLSPDSGNQLSFEELHLANRLDRDTSGVMIITKSHKVAAKLVKAFTNHKVRKTYIACCVGKAPKWDKLSIKSGHGRSKFGAWRVYALSDAGRKLPGGSIVRDMETMFEVLSVNGKRRFKEFSHSDEEEGNTMVVEEKSTRSTDIEKNEIVVRAYPRSGRTHQIRLHCQYLGISIIGDVKYEGVHEWNEKSYDGHQLHAESLSLEHPITGEPVLIQAPLPLWASQPL